MLLLGSFLLIFIGFVHSFLGEKYILIRLFKRDDLPQLLGSDWFTKRVLRFAWHLTTIAWWGFATILYFLGSPSGNLEAEILLTLAVVFTLSGILSFAFSHGKHLSWIVFFAIAGISAFGLM